MVTKPKKHRFPQKAGIPRNLAQSFFKAFIKIIHIIRRNSSRNRAVNDFFLVGNTGHIFVLKEQNTSTHVYKLVFIFSHIKHIRAQR